MIVLNKKPISLAEVKEYVKDVDENKILNDFLKKFAKLSKDKAIKLGEDIKALNNPKIKENDIVKVIDFLPETFEDVNKIFTDVSLLENEANTILEIVRKY